MAMFRLLGAFEVTVGDERIDLGPAKQQILLAALAVDTGRPVAADVLIDRIWDDDAPAEARKVLHTYIARVRRVLSRVPATIERRSGGYQLVVETDSVDLARYRRLVDEARRADPQVQADRLAEAVTLWRDEPLAGMPGAWAAGVRDRLRQQHIGVVADWALAELARGHHEAVLEVLPELTAAYPLAEPLVAR